MEFLSPLLVDESVPVHRWTRSEAQRLVDEGLLSVGARTELLDGVLVDMPILNPGHTAACDRIEDALTGAFPNCHLRRSKPIALDPYNEPEPDLAVIRGALRDYLVEHPSPAQVRMVIEDCDLTLHYARTLKEAAYATAGIPEYWIVNLADRQLEVFRGPSLTGYEDRQILHLGDSVTPLALPEKAFPIADLLI